MSNQADDIIYQSVRRNAIPIAETPQQGNGFKRHRSQEPYFFKPKEEIATFQSKKIKHRNRLFNLLAKYFLNLHFDHEDFDLSPLDVFLTAHILHRKFIVDKRFYSFGHNYNISIEQLIQLIEQSKSAASTKRPEENIKFVFKITVKRLKEALKERSDDAFYSHYFSDQAPDRDFAKFKDPLNNSVPKQKGQPKTISQKYLRLIFESPKFKHDFAEFVSGASIIIDYQKTIQKKLQKCIVGLEKRFVLNDTLSAKDMDAVGEYVLKNKFFKLPWTVIEINNAVKYFCQLVESFGTKSRASSKK